MMITTTLLACLLFCSALCFAQYTDEQLYKAFLQQDMSVWRDFVTTSKWEELSVKDRKRLINYEYGFLATAIDQKDPHADEYLSAFRRHVETEYKEGHISEAYYCMYMSSVNAYDFMLNKSRLFSAGLQSFKLVKRAAELAEEEGI